METSIPYHKLADESLPSFHPMQVESRSAEFSPSNLTSNRSKGVIFVNLFCFLNFCYLIASKYIMKTYGVSSTDFLFFRTLAILITHTCLIILS